MCVMDVMSKMSFFAKKGGFSGMRKVIGGELY